MDVSVNVNSNSNPSGCGRGAAAASSFDISVLHLNARSLYPKLSELASTASSLRPDVIAVTETLLSSSVPDGVLLLPDYAQLVRVDRSCSSRALAQGGGGGVKKVKQRGGGVLFLIKSSVKFSARPDLCSWPESAWIELSSPTGPLMIRCFYRSPNSCPSSFAASLETSLCKLDLSRTNVLLVGDFNAKSPSWNPADSFNSAGQILEPEFLRLGLCQCVTSPTHLSPDGSLGSTLDLVLVSDPSCLKCVSTHPPLGSSDHLSVLCHVDIAARCSSRSERLGRKIWCFDKADFGTINDNLRDADWRSVYSAPDVDSAWTAWQETFFSIVDKGIPSKFIKRLKHKNPFVTTQIAAAIKEKRVCLRRFKKQPSVANRESFKRARNIVTHLLRKSERAHATSLHRSLRLVPCPSTSRDFWHHMKVLQGKLKRPFIPDLVAPDASVEGTAAGKAKLLNDFFAQQTILNGAATATLLEDSLPRNDHSFSTISTTPSEVYGILSTLKERKASGLDGISPRLLKFCAGGISESLCSLFNRSFDEGHFPKAWRSALVVPIFKKGAANNPSNYRPIALLSTVSKVMERIVHNKLYRFLRPWLNHNQSGFKKKDGTVPQLVRLVQTWSEAIDQSQYVGVVFFDLKKAFDRVWHRGLLVKLRAAGVSGMAYNWFSSFLSDRRQATLVDGVLSDFSSLHAGVPQGAILSPLLFSIYMNDIPSCASLGGSTNLFADDTSSFVADKSLSSLSIKLQGCVDTLSSWFDSWLLSVNTLKSAFMVLRSRRMPSSTLQLSVNGCAITQVSTHRHLGLVLNESLSWSDHVDFVVSKASTRIGFLRRLKHKTSPLVVRDLYMYCIRPILEYAHVAWAGLSVANDCQLEKCNRNAARLIASISPSAGLSHEVILARAGLSTLSSRRQVAQSLFVRRLLTGKQPYHIRAAAFAWLSSHRPANAHNMVLRDRDGRLRLPRPKKNCLKLSPFYSAFSVWNSMPSSVRSSPSVAAITSFFCA